MSISRADVEHIRTEVKFRIPQKKNVLVTIENDKRKSKNFQKLCEIN